MTSVAGLEIAGSVLVPHDAGLPFPGSEEEMARFAGLQARLAPLFRRAFPDPRAPQTIVVVPSMTLDAAELRKLKGAPHYEERLLCLLMLLRRPRTHLVYVTSQPIPPVIVDYYLHLLPGVPLSHARKRLTLLSCHDGSAVPLTQKVLSRPRLLERIRAAIPDAAEAHLTCFNATALERSLAVRLDVPLYACDPALYRLGTKSGGREIFRRAGVPLPDGFEHLRDEGDVVEGLAALKRRDPALRRAVVKLNDGFSGEGNAVFAFDGAPASGLDRWVSSELPGRLRFVAPDESWDPFRLKLGEMGGIVEAFVEDGDARSPSVQCRIDPTGAVSVISTHDQVLGGTSGQVFTGCTFPACPEYVRQIQDAGLRVAEVLRDEGVVGRFGVDFMVTRKGGGWEHRALEINLRKGGTTHTYLMLQFLTDGTYDTGTGLYHTPTGHPCFYRATDNLESPAYRALSPDDLIDISVYHGLHFHAAGQQGTVFHLIGALSEFGKLGALCIGDTPQAAERRFRQAVEVLDREARLRRTGLDAYAA